MAREYEYSVANSDFGYDKFIVHYEYDEYNSSIIIEKILTEEGFDVYNDPSPYLRFPISVQEKIENEIYDFELSKKCDNFVEPEDYR